MPNHKFTSDWFFSLDKSLRTSGQDSDAQSFDEILSNLKQRKIYSPTEFAHQCFYVILAGGFSQQTAKKIHEKITHTIDNKNANFDSLIQIFNNKNKINAICKIWDSRKNLCDQYYKLNTLDDKLDFLQSLPHIGKITANHLARNLGEDIVKYDIWIQRLGCTFANRTDLTHKINNAKLCDEIKTICDNMFTHLHQETGLPRGYIDVVLWKSLQTGLIKL